MRYRLVPGLFSEQIECDDAHHLLLVGLYQVPFSPTQYALVMTLLHQRERWLLSRQREPLYVNVTRLMQVTCLARPAYIKQHVFRANLRLEGRDIFIGCLQSCYAILPRSDLPPSSLLNERRTNLSPV